MLSSRGESTAEKDDYTWIYLEDMFWGKRNQNLGKKYPNSYFKIQRCSSRKRKKLVCPTDRQPLIFPVTQVEL